MELFQVIEDGEGIERAILQALPARSGQERRVSERHPALLVVSPRAAARGMQLPTAAEQGIPLPRQCRTVLLPGEMGGAPLRAASAVSYGVSPRDSLTISSRERDTLWAALQRELVTVDGRVVEQQEFPVSLGQGEEELSALAAAGALILLGVPPEKLGRG